MAAIHTIFNELKKKNPEIFYREIKSEWQTYVHNCEEEYVLGIMSENELFHKTSKPIDSKLKKRKAQIEKEDQKIYEFVKNNFHPIEAFPEFDTKILIPHKNMLEEVKKHCTFTEKELNKVKKFQYRQVTLNQLEKVIPQKLKLLHILSHLKNQGIVFEKNKFKRYVG